MQNTSAYTLIKPSNKTSLHRKDSNIKFYMKAVVTPIIYNLMYLQTNNVQGKNVLRRFSADHVYSSLVYWRNAGSTDLGFTFALLLYLFSLTTRWQYKPYELIMNFTFYLDLTD